MSLPVLRAINALVENGAVVAGPKPTDDPSLADAQAEFQRLSSQLFGDGGGVHKVGKGAVYAGQDLREVFTALNVPPDFDYAKADSSNIEFVHRELPSGDIYFVDNRSDHDLAIQATFRVVGREPELWRAETASTESVSFQMADGRTTVPLRLEPWGTVFVVFRKATSKASLTLPVTTEAKLATIEGPWKVAFQPGRGAPDFIIMAKLSDWSQSDNSGVKYFSGVGTYTNTLQASADWFHGQSRFWIDLGEVKNLAVVTINGKELGQVWHPPYRLEITSALKPGENRIKIEVVNAWVNRLIGDEQPGATRFTFADVKPYKANSPLLPSGLLGPVTVVQAAPK
jgi:hypothetical protein